MCIDFQIKWKCYQRECIRVCSCVFVRVFAFPNRMRSNFIWITATGDQFCHNTNRFCQWVWGFNMAMRMTLDIYKKVIMFYISNLKEDWFSMQRLFLPFCRHFQLPFELFIIQLPCMNRTTDTCHRIHMKPNQNQHRSIEIRISLEYLLSIWHLPYDAHFIEFGWWITCNCKILYNIISSISFDVVRVIRLTKTHSQFFFFIKNEIGMKKSMKFLFLVNALYV